MEYTAKQDKASAVTGTGRVWWTQKGSSRNSGVMGKSLDESFGKQNKKFVMWNCTAMSIYWFALKVSNFISGRFP